MRVLLVAPDLTVKGGITTVIEGILSSKLADRHEFVHLSTHRDDLSKFGKLLCGLRAYARFVRLAATFKPSLVHVHSSFGASFFRKAVILVLGRMFRLRQINHIHGADFDGFYRSAGEAKRRLVRSIYDLANSTIVLSKERENRVAAICRRSNVYRLHNFAALPTPAEDEGTRNYSSRRNVVLFLGEVGRRKGAFDIPAIIELVATTVRDVLFIVAGNGEIGAVKDMIEAKGYGKNAIFTGWIGPDAKKESLLEARVFLLPSYNEEFPMSVLEAMSYGLPVVSTRVGGVPELVVDDVNGYLFDPGDVKGIADAIVALLEDSAKAYAMGRTNMEKMRSRYSLDAYADELETIYKETVKLGAARSMTECNT